jgi:3',5'-nucleoside bisphosphate phosphatase
MSPRPFRADLHLHTCLSPCGDLGIYPRSLVARAIEIGLDIVAVTDHNSAGNAAATVRAARGTGLKVLPGLEIASAEEAHVLGLFATVKDALAVQAEVYRGLPRAPASATVVREQVVVDAKDGITGFCRRVLMAAARLEVKAVVELIHGRGGLAIAAHIDRPSFSIVSQLGFIPPGLGLDAVEVSSSAPDAGGPPPGPGPVPPRVRFSDAHATEEIGRSSTTFLLEAASLAEIAKALRGEDGRRILEP